MFLNHCEAQFFSVFFNWTSLCLVTSQGIERPQALNRLFQEFRVPRHETSGRICQSNVKHRVRCCIVLVLYCIGQCFWSWPDVVLYILRSVINSWSITYCFSKLIRFPLQLRLGSGDLLISFFNFATTSRKSLGVTWLFSQILCSWEANSFRMTFPYTF